MIYIVNREAGRVSHEVCAFDTEREAVEFCERQRWIDTPDGIGGFEWDLVIEECEAYNNIDDYYYDCFDDIPDSYKPEI